VARERGVGEQVRSGLRIAGRILLVFAAFTLLEVCLVYLTGLADASAIKKFLAALVAAGVVAFMFRTTMYWAKWLLAALGFCLVRLVGGVLLGPYFSKPLSRDTAAVWMLYTGAAVALTVRYSGKKPRGFERLGLVSFIVCIALAFISGSQKQLWLGLGLLGLSELTQWLTRRGAHRPHESVAARPPE